MLYIVSLLAAIYFRTGLYLEGLYWPSALDWPPSLLRAGFVSVTLVSFHIPPPFFNLLFKTPMILSDTAIAVVLYRLCLAVTKSPKHGEKAMMLWYLNPLVIWISSIHGAFDSLAVLFAVLGFYFMVVSNFAASGFLLATGALTKLYPAFLIPLSFTESFKARRVSRFLIGVLLSFAVCLAPVFILDNQRFLYVLTANRPSALFVGGMNLFAVKYIFKSVEAFVFENSTAVFLFLVFLIGLTSLMLCSRSRESSPRGEFASRNRMMLMATTLAYFFLPIIVQPQYGLWALPFMIMDIAPIAYVGSTLHSVRVRIQANGRTLVDFNYKLSYRDCFSLFWVSALVFEFALQGPSVFLPVALRNSELTHLLAGATEFWVKDKSYLRSMVFFLSGLACTFSYVMFLLKSLYTSQGKVGSSESTTSTG